MLLMSKELMEAKAESIRATLALEAAQAVAGNSSAARWALDIPELEDAVIAADERVMALEKLAA